MDGAAAPSRPRNGRTDRVGEGRKGQPTCRQSYRIWRRSKPTDAAQHVREQPRLSGLVVLKPAD
jgi:hypothetical protein